MKIKNKIILILISIITAVTMNNSISNAATLGLTSDSVGQVVSAGYNTLMGDNAYCIQYGQWLNGYHNYTVAHYVKIVGNKAEFKNYNTPSTSNSNKYANGIMAYILGADYDSYKYSYSGENYTNRQKLIWREWNDFAVQNEAQFGENLSYYGNSNTSNQSIYEKAVEYAENVDSGVKATASIEKDKTTTSEGTYEGYEKVGPLSVTYTGKITSTTVTDKDGKQINDNIEFYQWGKKTTATELDSGIDFYILNKSGRNAKNINIKVSASSEEIITAEIWVLKSSQGAQNLMIAETKKEPNVSSDEINIKVNRQEEGNIVLHKQDASKKTALKGAQFKVFIGTKQEGNHWLSIDSTGAYAYTSDFEHAKVFTSDEAGNIEINNLRSGYKVSIYEVKAPEGYDLKSQKGYDEANNRVWCNQKYYTITTNTQDDKITLTNSKTGNIEIIKKDTTTAVKLSGAEFKVSVNAEGNKANKTWLKKNSDGTYSYDATFNDATKFGTTDGTCKIEDLDPQTYFIYEVTAPKGYNIKAQDNYDSSNNWVKCGKANVTSGATAKVDLKNTEYINIEGYVWVDEPQTKANNYNSLYDSTEKKITDNVTITLRKKSDNSEVAKATINKDTQTYRFEKIDYKRLSEYYVNFDYSGTNYKSYITVDAIFDKAEGSKALADNVPDYDKDLVGIATTYKGKDNEAKYGLSYLATKFYNENSYTVENVNLGIKGLPATPFTVSENLAYVDVKIKGYNYRYIYGGTGAKLQTVPTVQWQSKTDKESYTRDIYPSDIIYENPQDKTQELQMYATYRVDVTNNTNIDVPYLYQEKSLNVTKIINKFDASRYELQDNNWETTNEANVVQMKQEYLQKQYYDDYSKENGISNESDKNNKYAYITFKVKPEAIKGVLKVADGTIEDFPTTAEVTAYHKYTRIDSSWKNNLTKTQTHYTRESTQSDSAPYMILKQGKNRTISGKVFEDKNSRTNGELVGNGMYDQNENKVQGVTVELGNYSNNEFIPTNLYKVDGAGNAVLVNNNEYAKASMKTTEKEGTYSFEGVVPGEYFIRFTYGDGTQKIVDLNGNEVKKVSSNEYKSTIVTDEIRKAFETKYDATKATWYIGIGENHNIAVDDLNARKAMSDGKYEITATSLQNRTSTNITAQTPELSVPIEFTDKQEGSVTEQYPNELGYIDFGIIQIPRTRLDLSKKITNVKVTDQQGKVVLEGNPATQNVAYTTDLDKKTNGGSTYVKIEVDNVYGGTLEIKYEIEVQNNSDLDYMEAEGDNHYGYYYKYGIKDYAAEKKIEISKVYDYLDPKLSYTSKEGKPEVNTIDISEFKNKDENTTTAEQKEILSLVKAQEEKTDLTFNRILEITNIGELYSSKGQNKDQSSNTVIINANKKLTTGEDDLEFINIAEVIKVKTEPITAANVEFPESTSTGTYTQTIATTPTVRLTVTPPTGENRNMIYFVVGTIALVVVAGGVAMIRRHGDK